MPRASEFHLARPMNRMPETPADQHLPRFGHADVSQRKPGIRERGDSAWLGQPVAASEVFQRYRDIDRWLSRYRRFWAGKLDDLERHMDEEES